MILLMPQTLASSDTFNCLPLYAGQGKQSIRLSTDAYNEQLAIPTNVRKLPGHSDLTVVLCN